MYILERLLYRIRPEDDPKKRIKPCEVFDIIVGTSTGGLIAIMLGILVGLRFRNIPVLGARQAELRS